MNTFQSLIDDLKYLINNYENKLNLINNNYQEVLDEFNKEVKLLRFTNKKMQEDMINIKIIEGYEQKKKDIINDFLDDYKVGSNWVLNIIYWLIFSLFFYLTLGFDKIVLDIVLGFIVMMVGLGLVLLNNLVSYTKGDVKIVKKYNIKDLKEELLSLEEEKVKKEERIGELKNSLIDIEREKESISNIINNLKNNLEYLENRYQNIKENIIKNNELYINGMLTYDAKQRQMQNMVLNLKKKIGG